MLTGDNPEEFKIFDISKSIGCPAPRTITSAEVSFKAPDQPAQNVAIWLSDKGPMMFMGNTIRRIPGVENYFDQSSNSTSTLDINNISVATAYFDPAYQEWNLLFPVGTNGGQATNNKWLAYDVVRDKWYEKKPHASAIFPQGGFVVRDTYGNNMVYAYDNSGYVWELEQGSFNWYSGTPTAYAISGVVTTSDFFFTQSFWDRIRLRGIETIWGEADLTELNNTASIAIQYYRDASVNPTVTLDASDSPKTMALANYRLRHLIFPVNYVGWSHRLKYTITEADSKISLYGIGMKYQHQFEEMLDEDDTPPDYTPAP
jgi:hypothetical protein